MSLLLLLAATRHAYAPPEYKHSRNRREYFEILHVTGSAGRYMNDGRISNIIDESRLFWDFIIGLLGCCQHQVWKVIW
jgi:hypothetical protein